MHKILSQKKQKKNVPLKPKKKVHRLTLIISNLIRMHFRRRFSQLPLLPCRPIYSLAIQKDHPRNCVNFFTLIFLFIGISITHRRSARHKRYFPYFSMTLKFLKLICDARRKYFAEIKNIKFRWLLVSLGA